jgi:hypothetical protein
LKKRKNVFYNNVFTSQYFLDQVVRIVDPTVEVKLGFERDIEISYFELGSRSIFAIFYSKTTWRSNEQRGCSFNNLPPEAWFGILKNC